MKLVAVQPMNVRPNNSLAAMAGLPLRLAALCRVNDTLHPSALYRLAIFIMSRRLDPTLTAEVHPLNDQAAGAKGSTATGSFASMRGRVTPEATSAPRGTTSVPGPICTADWMSVVDISHPEHARKSHENT